MLVGRRPEHGVAVPSWLLEGLTMNIRELIASTRGDRSYAQLAEARPDSPSRQFWQQLATQEQKTFPKPETIRAIAEVLGVTPAVVVLAWAESLGIPMRSESRLAMLLPPGTESLSDPSISAVLTLVRELIHSEPSNVVPLSAPPGRPSRGTPMGEQRVASQRQRETETFDDP